MSLFILPDSIGRASTGRTMNGVREKWLHVIIPVFAEYECFQAG
jgi:hypothetical protein